MQQGSSFLSKKLNYTLAASLLAGVTFIAVVILPWGFGLVIIFSITTGCALLICRKAIQRTKFSDRLVGVKRVIVYVIAVIFFNVLICVIYITYVLLFGDLSPAFIWP